MENTESKNRVRYTADQKAEALKFIQEFNAKNKRGGQKAAAEKFGITQMTLGNWEKAAKNRKRVAGQKERAQSVSSLPSAQLAPKYARLAQLHKQIAFLESQVECLVSLRKEVAEVEASLRA